MNKKPSEIKKEHLTLKWGTLKDWSFGEWARPLMVEYNSIGSSMSAIMQQDTPRQKEIICELIDKGSFKKVHLDWEGKNVSKKKAKEYVLGY